MSIDPVGFKPSRSGSFNRYSYTENDPINQIDPDEQFVMASSWGYTVKFIKGGLKKVKRLETKQDATAAARKGADIESAGGLKTARSVAKDTVSQPGALRKDPGHVLRDGSGKVGKPHFHNGRGSHIFYSVVGGTIVLLETIESLDPLQTGYRIPDCYPGSCNIYGQSMEAQNGTNNNTSQSSTNTNSNSAQSSSSARNATFNNVSAISQSKQASRIERPEKEE